MDYNKIVSNAEDKLINSHPEVIKDLKDIIASGSTGGEIIGMTEGYFKSLEYSNKDAYYCLS
jgi:hypothetical protein